MAASGSRTRSAAFEKLEGVDGLSWGERLTVAYRRQKASRATKHRDVAAAVHGFHSTDPSGSSVARLERHAEVPSRADSRRLAYFVILAYGYDPADFGLNESNVALAGIDPKKARDQLLRALNRIPIYPDEAIRSMLLPA